MFVINVLATIGLATVIVEAISGVLGLLESRSKQKLQPLAGRDDARRLRHGDGDAQASQRCTR